MRHLMSVRIPRRGGGYGGLDGCTIGSFTVSAAFLVLVVTDRLFGLAGLALILLFFLILAVTLLARRFLGGGILLHLVAIQICT